MQSRIRDRSCQHDIGSLYIQPTKESFVKLVHYLTGALLSLRGTCCGLSGQFESDNAISLAAYC